jgi:hypothetical protein
MKRLWRILNSRDFLREMLCWAADSKVGAVCTILWWVSLHVVLVWIVVSGNSGFYDRRRDPILFWFEVLPCAVSMFAIDAYVAWNIICDRTEKRPNKSPQRNAGIGPATLGSAIPLPPAMSSEKTARPQSPRG